MDAVSLLARRGLVPPGGDREPRLLEDPRAWELIPRFCGDRSLDAAVAFEDAHSFTEALWGANRVTRHLVRSGVDALLGPPAGRHPGRNAAWWSISIGIGVDGGPPSERLDAQDLAMILASGARNGAPVRREPLRAVARARLQALLRGTPRHIRRNLGIELVLDPSSRPERMARLLTRSHAMPDRIIPAHVHTVDGLYQAVELLTGRLATQPLALSRIAAEFEGSPVALVAGYEVRLITTQGQATFEALQMRNCLATHAPTALRRGNTLATLWRNGQPVATVELDPAGDVATIRGPGNRWMDGARRRAVMHALAGTGLFPVRCAEQVRGPAEEIAARVSCRTAALLAAELDPELNRSDVWADGYAAGDRALELLGDRAAWLSERQLARIRGERLVGPSPSDTCPEEGEWTRIATMLALSGVGAEVLDPPTTTEARLAARRFGLGLLRRQLQLPDRAPPPDSRVLIDDPTLPWSARRGIGEVLGVWSRWGQGQVADE